MNSEYLDPENEREGTQTEKEALKSASNKAENSLEKKGPNKAKNPKVLHKDGSFADLPYNNEPGGGALEGTVGIGT
jgi:hypothetical protein